MPPRNAASVLSPVALLVVAAVALMAGLHAVRGPAPEALLQGSQHYALVELPDQQPERAAAPTFSWLRTQGMPYFQEPRQMAAGRFEEPRQMRAEPYFAAPQQMAAERREMSNAEAPQQMAAGRDSGRVPVLEGLREMVPVAGHMLTGMTPNWSAKGATWGYSRVAL
ncbi:hypothetical protein T484DRAFT_1853828 [Baffinella frigidus]|nr:hypothetical protein T484DRAFT_1853828 [Cryptophyta sp. CCMP2293]